MTDTSARFADRFGSRTGEFALIVAGTVILGFLFPGAAFLGVVGARYSGVRARPGRMRALLIVAIAVTVLYAVSIYFAFQPVMICSSLDGGPTHCG